MPQVINSLEAHTPNIHTNSTHTHTHTHTARSTHTRTKIRINFLISGLEHFQKTRHALATGQHVPGLHRPAHSWFNNLLFKFFSVTIAIPNLFHKLNSHEQVDILISINQALQS